MAEVITDVNPSGTETISKRKKETKLSVGKVLESRAFAMAMNVASKYAAGKSKIYRLLNHAFEKLREESNRKLFKKDFKEKTQTLMRMAKAYIEGQYRKIPSETAFRIIGGLIYFVWILDFIPDFFPIIGLADDLAVIVWVYNGINHELEDFERWERSEGMVD